MRYLAALQVFVLAATTNAATLEWKFAPGDQEQYRMTQVAKLSGSQTIAEVEQDLGLEWKVLEAGDDGIARISLRVSSFSFLAKGPDGQEVRLDSQSSEEPQGYSAMLAPIGKQLAETSVEFSMSRTGKVSDMKVPDQLAGAVKSIPSGKKFGQDGGMESFEAFARLGAPWSFPRGEVADLQEWAETRDVEMPVLGKLNAEYVYKVVGEPTETEATIEQRLRVAQEQTAKSRLINQESSGTIVFNIEAGRPENSTLTFRAELPTDDAGQSHKVEYSLEYRRVVDTTQ